MSSIMINRKLGSNLGFCAGGMQQFIDRSGIKPGRKGVTPEEFAAKWSEMPLGSQQRLALEYGSYLGMLARAVGYADQGEWLGIEDTNPLEGLHLGRAVGKPKFVSGKTAYEQEYEGTMNGPIIMCISYRTPVGVKFNGKSYATVARYSVTTSKHMGRFRIGYGDIPVTEQQLRDLMRTGK